MTSDYSSILCCSYGDSVTSDMQKDSSISFKSGDVIVCLLGKFFYWADRLSVACNTNHDGLELVH